MKLSKKVWRRSRKHTSSISRRRLRNKKTKSGYRKKHTQRGGRYGKRGRSYKRVRVRTHKRGRRFHRGGFNCDSLDTRDLHGRRMYYGDTDIFMASSDDLKSWDACENEESKKLISVLHPRMGYHDSRLVEPGPYALKTKDGILLIYNGSNAANFNDTKKPKFTYSAGQALFAINEPYKLIDRTTTDFIHPDKPYERTGEVNEVCFVEGLVHFNNNWFLYYGTADSRIAVAVK
jgi:hypothetical protein